MRMNQNGLRKYSNNFRKYSEDVSEISFIMGDNDNNSNNQQESSDYNLDHLLSYPPNRKNSSFFILHQNDDKNNLSNHNLNNNNNNIINSNLSNNTPTNNNQMKSSNCNEGKYFLIEKAFQDYAILDQINENEPNFQELRQDEWEEIFDQEKIDSKLFYKLTNSLFKGITYENRIRLWPILANIEYLEFEYGSQVKDYYFKTHCQYENQIDEDIIQTIIHIENNLKAKSKSALFIQSILPDLLMQTKKICRAYAHFDKEVGYVKNMCWIILAIINYLHYDNDKEFQDTYIIDKRFERKVFWIFVHIMYQKQWRTLFIDGQPGLTIISKNIEKKMEEYLPNLHHHILKLQLNYKNIFDQELLTLFQKNICKSFGKRMLDMFLLDGEEIFLSVYLVIIKTFEKKILQCKTKSQLIKYVQEEMKDEWYELYNNKTSSLNFDEYQTQLNQTLYTQIQF